MSGWWRHGDSNPDCQREGLMSWPIRRWRHMDKKLSSFLFHFLYILYHFFPKKSIKSIENFYFYEKFHRKWTKFTYFIPFSIDLFTKPEQNTKFFTILCEFLEILCGEIIPRIRLHLSGDIPYLCAFAPTYLEPLGTIPLKAVSDSAMLHLAEGAGLEPTMRGSKPRVIPLNDPSI